MAHGEEIEFCDGCGAILESRHFCHLCGTLTEEGKSQQENEDDSFWDADASSKYSTPLWDAGACSKQD